MLPLAHLGIGGAIGRTVARRAPFGWILLGTMLPDLIDKPAYLLMGLYARYDHGGWVPGKRGLAHTLLFWALVMLVARLRRSPRVLAIGVGIATHLVLDAISKVFGPRGWQGLDGVATVLLWPLRGVAFPTLSYGVHGTSALVLEACGGVALSLQLFWLHRNRRISRAK